MKGKLIDVDNIYTLYVNGKMFATNDEDFQNDDEVKKLSIKNCQSIEKGYDFDEYIEGVFYAGQFGHPSPEGFSDEQIGRLHGFIDGFQKALELIGGKKYSEGDMWNMFWFGDSLKNKIQSGKIENKHMGEIFGDYIQSLKVPEWDVEIIMSDVVTDDFVGMMGIPKLDSEGCLILKRI